jgi:DNA invertase Pin-like site-specific DNA recombinase
LSKLFLTIAAAFAEAERDRIRERIGQSKADQKARGRYLGGRVPFGFRRGDDGGLVPHQVEQEQLVSYEDEQEAIHGKCVVTGRKRKRYSSFAEALAG